MVALIRDVQIPPRTHGHICRAVQCGLDRRAAVPSKPGGPHPCDCLNDPIGAHATYAVVPGICDVDGPIGPKGDPPGLGQQRLRRGDAIPIVPTEGVPEGDPGHTTRGLSWAYRPYAIVGDIDDIDRPIRRHLHVPSVPELELVDVDHRLSHGSERIATEVAAYLTKDGAHRADLSLRAISTIQRLTGEVVVMMLAQGPPSQVLDRDAPGIENRGDDASEQEEANTPA